MSKPEWGTKRTCLSCGTRFYDLQHSPIVCPNCGAEYSPDAVVKTRRVVKKAVPHPAPVPKPKPVAPEAHEAAAEEPEAAAEDEEPEALIEDTSDLVEDDDDMAEVMDHLDSGEDD